MQSTEPWTEVSVCQNCLPDVLWYTSLFKRKWSCLHFLGCLSFLSFPEFLLAYFSIFSLFFLLNLPNSPFPYSRITDFLFTYSFFSWFFQLFLFSSVSSSWFSHFSSSPLLSTDRKVPARAHCCSALPLPCRTFSFISHTETGVFYWISDMHLIKPSHRLLQ